MKTLKILFIILTIGSISGIAQSDSLRYSQENGTLEKQRFIDQYDYVFMTKEPTKWMVKLNMQPIEYNIKAFLSSPYDHNSFPFLPPKRLNLSPWWLYFERKITPSFSVQLGASYSQHSSNCISVNGENVPNLPMINYNGDKFKNATLGNKRLFFGSIEGRWYYGLKKRIEQGKSANNFSGNYFSLRLEKAFLPSLNENSTELTSTNGSYDTDYRLEQLKNRITLSYGIQRRFLRHGVVDFALNLGVNSYQQVRNQVTFLDGDRSVQTWENPRPNLAENIQSNWSDLGMRHDWLFKTEMRLGLAIGDFKKTPKQPLCDVLRCYEDKKSLLKIAWPTINIGSKEQLLSSTIAYEHKIGRLPISINTQLDVELMHGFYANVGYTSTSKIIHTDLSFLSTSITGTIQPRYYFTQARRIKKYGTGSNLSGFYAGFSISSIAERNRFQYAGLDNFTNKRNKLGLHPIVIGFQQKLFNNGYIDLNCSPFWIGNGDNPSFNIFGANLKLGFAF